MTLKHPKALYQVVILGGGPAGSACAISLARQGIQEILLVEAGEYDQFCIGESIPPETRLVFIRLGILEQFLAEGHEPCYGSRCYWGDDRWGSDDTPLGVYGHGWHLDRSRFNRFVAQQAEIAGASLMTGTTFQQCQKFEDGMFQLRIKMAQGELVDIKTRFVVDATGAQGVFARQQGSKQIMDRPLIGLGVRFSLKNVSLEIAQVTHLEAVEYGWWYVARLPDDMLLVMLTTDGETLKAMGLHQAKVWFDLLENTPKTGQWVADAEKVDACPMRFNAPSFLLDKTVGRHWMAIGDTASAYDPITSHGIIKALSDGIFAADIIAPYLRNQEDRLDNYQHTIAARYRQYADMRKYFYQIENRWPDSAFWRKHQA